MARRLNSKDGSFAAEFEALLNSRAGAEDDIGHQVKAIIADVRKRGDAALVELTNKLDGANVTRETLRLSAADMDVVVGKEQLAAMEVAAARIEAYHQKQLPQDADFTDASGARLGW